jgi:NAD(P)-dependent dehydrogenase (short-subunit alcohol dehydrogenase family)
MDTKKLGGLRTLGAILEFLSGADTSTPQVSASPAVKSAPQAAAKNGTRLERRGLCEVVAPATGQPIAGLTQAKAITVLDDGSDLGGVLVQRLRERGIRVDLTDTVKPGSDGVVVLGPRHISGTDHVLDSAHRLFGAAKDFAPRAANEGGAFITVQDSGGDFGLSGASNGNAWFAGLPGLIKTMGQEWPQVSVKAIDLERGEHAADSLADRLIGEFIAGGLEPEIGLRADGRRTTLKEVDLPLGLSRNSDLLQNRPVLVVTGGARGVTAACLLGLAKVAPMRLALIGRTPVEVDPFGLEGAVSEADIRAVLLSDARRRGEMIAPRELGKLSHRILANREIRSTLASLEACGSEVIYISGDVRDAAVVQKAVRMARERWGRIDGIVHGAGALADKRIEDKSLQQFDLVFATKVLGLRALLEATADDPLQLICLFSSVAGRYGNAGQADYALANDILNKVARSEAARRGERCLVRSLNWGPWDGGMVTPGLRDSFAGRGVPLISLDDGVAAFIDELRYGDSQPAHVDVVLSGRAV